ncbi:MAG TPA: MBL fold metallo-hydrolase [Spirochaetia bacterium]|nr:MBL fold metallo-hydrolase [Spirochaetia bacterium]
MKVRDLQNTPLALTNKGGLSIFVLGSGSAFSKKLNQNNVIIIKGKDHVMVDFGTKAPQAIHQLGLSVSDIRCFLITHSHADHIGGLEEVMLTGRYVARKKPRIVITTEYEKLLWDFSLKGGASFNELVDGRALEFSDLWDIIRPTWLPGYPRETYEAQIGSINLKMIRTNHYPEQATSWETSYYSVGILIDDRVLFTGDTKFDPKLLADFQKKFKIETIFHDVQFFPQGVHAFLTDLGKLPAATRKKMHLMHYSDNFEKFIPEVKELGFAGFVRQNSFYDFD